MSHSDWLRQFDLSSTTQNDAMVKAKEILEARRLKHLDFTMTAGTGEGAAGGDGNGQGAPSGSAGGDQGTTGDGSSGTGTKIENPEGKIAALAEEKDRQFAARQAAETKLAEYEAAEEERRRASQDELTNTKQDLERVQATLAQTQAMLDAALLDNAFLTDNEFQWQNPSRVLKLVDRDSVQIEGDKVKGVKEALKALAESDPYLLKPSEGQQQQEQGQQRGGSGPTAPAGNGQRGNSNGKKTPEELKKKYSALRR